MRILVFVFVFILMSSNFVIAAEGTAELSDESANSVDWKGMSGAGWNISEGNTNAINASLNATISRIAPMNDMLARTALNYGISRDNGGPTTTANNYFALYKLDIFLDNNKKWYWFAQPQYQSDEFQGIWSKWMIDSGFGYNWFGTKSPSLKTEIGYGLQYWLLVEDEEDGDNKRTTQNLVTRIAYKQRIKEYLAFSEDVVFYDELGGNDSYQAESITAATFTITKKFKYQTSLTVQFNNEPLLVEAEDIDGNAIVDANGEALLVPAEKFDIMWMNTLVWTFF